MGNSQQAKTKFEGGYLTLKLDKDLYYPGNTVYGKIYIRVERPMDPKQLQIRVQGLEHASYHPNGQAALASFKKVLYDFKGVCFNFQGPLAIGDFALPFEFDLPKEIPSTIFFHDDQSSRKPTVEVTHKITAIIEMKNEQFMEFEQGIEVRELPAEGFQENYTFDTSVVPRGGPCNSRQGKTEMKVVLPKNMYHGSEKVNVSIDINNSKSEYSVGGIHLELKQKMAIRKSPSEQIKHDQRFEYSLLAIDKEVSVSAMARSTKTINLELDLAKVPNGYVPPSFLQGQAHPLQNFEHNVGQAMPAEPASRSQSDLEAGIAEGMYSQPVMQQEAPHAHQAYAGQTAKPPQDVDMAVNSALPPMCHSEHIVNEYELTVKVIYHACCCPNAPRVYVPFLVVQSSRVLGFDEPIDGQIIELGFFKFELAPPPKKMSAFDRVVNFIRAV